jgi:hypothetical protein
VRERARVSEQRHALGRRRAERVHTSARPDPRFNVSASMTASLRASSTATGPLWISRRGAGRSPGPTASGRADELLAGLLRRQTLDRKEAGVGPVASPLPLPPDSSSEAGPPAAIAMREERQPSPPLQSRAIARSRRSPLSLLPRCRSDARCRTQCWSWFKEAARPAPPVCAWQAKQQRPQVARHHGRQPVEQAPIGSVIVNCGAFRRRRV